MIPCSKLLIYFCTTTLNKGFKGTKKLKGLIVENCRCLKRDIQPPNTSLTIDVQLRKIFI